MSSRRCDSKGERPRAAPWTHPVVVAVLSWGVLALAWQVAYFSSADLGMASLVFGAGLLAILVTTIGAVVHHALQVQWSGGRACHALGLLGIGVALVAVYLHLNRPDFDDGLFLARSLDLLLQPDEPLRKLGQAVEPGAYREDRLLTAYWVLPVLLHQWTGWPFLLLYYTLVPIPLILALPWGLDLAARDWLGIRKWGTRVALVGAAALLLLYWGKPGFWGSYHFGPMDDGIVRFFQGDAVLATLLVPVWLAVVPRALEDPGPGAALGVLGLVTAGVGFSEMAIFLGLLFLGICGTVEVIRKWSGGIGGVRILSPALVYLTGLAGISFLFFDSRAGFLDYGLFSPDLGWVWRSSNKGALQATWGIGAPGMVGVLSVLYFGIFGRCERSRMFAGVFLSLLVIPGTTVLLGELGYNAFAWRWLWVFPIFLVVPLAFAEGVRFFYRDRWWLGFLFAVAVLYLYGIDPRPAFHPDSGDLGTVVEWAPVKVREGEELRNGFVVELNSYRIQYRGHEF